MSTEGIKENLVPEFMANGEPKFYRTILFLAMQKLVLMNKGLYRGIPPNLEYLEYHDRFIILYRREGDELYLRIAKMLRKAAHKIYRIMLKKNMTSPDPRFLNLV
jgi:hypothetical protein